MKIFLTGATGYVGSAVAATLIRAKHEVTALVRSSTSAARVLSYGITPHRGDLRDPDSFAAAAREADVIVHAGVEGGEDRMQVDRTFVDALAGPSLVYTSVLFVLGNVDGGDESSPATGVRAEHEHFVLEAGGAVIRPGMIWGDDAWLFNHPLYIEPGTNRWPLVQRDDLADLYRLVVEQNARGIFHGVTEVRAAREVFPGHGRTLEDARADIGGFADALALDQNVHAPRSAALGWRPAKRYSVT
jgi:uncharacterized protein YbjT (DUF2867 family)